MADPEHTPTLGALMRAKLWGVPALCSSCTQWLTSFESDTWCRKFANSNGRAGARCRHFEPVPKDLTKS